MTAVFLQIDPRSGCTQVGTPLVHVNQSRAVLRVEIHHAEELMPPLPEARAVATASGFSSVKALLMWKAGFVSCTRTAFGVHIPPPLRQIPSGCRAEASAGPAAESPGCGRCR